MKKEKHEKSGQKSVRMMVTGKELKKDYGKLSLTYSSAACNNVVAFDVYLGSAVSLTDVTDFDAPPPMVVENPFCTDR